MNFFILKSLETIKLFTVPIIFTFAVSKGLSLEMSKSAKAAKLKTYLEPFIAFFSLLMFNVLPKINF